ncbi:uncharacterized protein G2W53_016967 [Senna tora]|uniref:Uncharacterized protein n=1 Tax=Senna tora TaxID=362788 RepID=A0A834TP07_9FABA|nr:uncharacterized protein G2W53_016967 [Senna tora]
MNERNAKINRRRVDSEVMLWEGDTTSSSLADPWGRRSQFSSLTSNPSHRRAASFFSSSDFSCYVLIWLKSISE